MRINRNILECKLNTEQDDREQIEVLIETYWNVNETFFEKACKFFKVLIETYWNVNIGKLFPARLHRLQTTVGSGTRKRI